MWTPPPVAQAAGLEDDVAGWWSGDHSHLGAMLGAFAILLLNAGVTALAAYGLAAQAAHVWKLKSWIALAAGIAGLGVLGMLQFWVMFFDVGLAGWMRALVWLGLGALVVLAALRRATEDVELLPPCLAVFAGTVALLAWSLLPTFTTDPNGVQEAGSLFRYLADRWARPLPGDNEIPYIFAQQLRAAQITTPFYGDWLSSDRPPLQTGMYLLLNMGGPGHLAYQASASSLQMLALPAVWILCRSMGAGRVWSALAMLALWSTPLAIVNGVFVWPKMLAGAYAAVAAALYFGPDREDRSTLAVVLATACASLAMLSHGATAFVILGFGLAVLLTWRWPSVRQAAAAVGVAALLYLPWSAYQASYDPPGNRLMKWHLAGSPQLDDRSLLQTLADQYGALSVEAWLRGRLENLGTVFVDPFVKLTAFLSGRESVQDLSNAAFFLIPLGMGPAAIALYGVAGFLFLNRTRAMAIAVIGALSVWMILTFEPGQAITHQGSYFPQIALIALLVSVFATLPGTSRVGAGLVVLHCALLGLFHAAI